MLYSAASLLSDCPIGGRVLDVGCAGYSVEKKAKALGRHDLKHAGVDYSPSGDAPDGFEMETCDLNAEPIPFSDDSFDLVIATHVIEHISDPISFFREIGRVTKPGGSIYIEAPSERSTMVPGMWFAFEDTRSLSFWDDPTHLGRPWPPQALHRLAMCYGYEPVAVGYRTSWKDKFKSLVKIPLSILLHKPDWLETGVWSLIGWASFAVVRKPNEDYGAPIFRYYLRSR